MRSLIILCILLQSCATPEPVPVLVPVYPRHPKIELCDQLEYLQESHEMEGLLENTTKYGQCASKVYYIQKYFNELDKLEEGK